MLVPATKLDAVNLLLDTISQAPVNTLSGMVSVDVKRAVNILDHVSREVQARGCQFNSEDCYPLTPDNSGLITLPENLISVRLDINRYPKSSYDVTIRAGRLYNRVTHSYVFSEEIKASVILLLDFEDLPQYAKWYVTVRSAVKFCDTSLGSDAAHKYTSDDEASALRDFRKEELDDAERSMLTPLYANHTLRVSRL